jgi:hypothetical protein
MCTVEAGITAFEAQVTRRLTRVMVRRMAREIQKPLNRSSRGTFRSFQRQLLRDGRNSLIRSKDSIERKLAEHIQKLKEIKESGGHSSSEEREIRAFESQLEALRELLN